MVFLYGHEFHFLFSGYRHKNNRREIMEACGDTNICIYTSIFCIALVLEKDGGNVGAFY